MDLLEASVIMPSDAKGHRRQIFCPTGNQARGKSVFTLRQVQGQQSNQPGSIKEPIFQFQRLIVRLTAKIMTVFLTVRRLAVCLFAVGTAAWAQTNAPFFDNTVLQEIRLTVQPSDWQALRDRYLENTYYPADFVWNGTTVARVGIRSRGSGSRSPQKPNLTVSFDRYVSKQKFLGLSTVTLKANNQDPSTIRETVSMALMQRMGMPAPREAHTRLFLNGEFFGLYTIVEAIDQDLLARVYDQSGGYLYEYNADFNYHFEYLGEDASKYAHFEPKTHEKDPDTPTLVQMIRTINQAPASSFAAAVSRYVNLRGFVMLIAVENYLADNDGVLSSVFGMNNFYLYRREENTVAEFIPWDCDLTFSSDSRPILQEISGNILARRAFAVPELRRLYLETLVQAAAIAGGEGGWMEQEIRRQYRLIAEDARRDPHKQCLTATGVQPCTAQDFEDHVGLLLGFPQMRLDYVLREVDRLSVDSAPHLTDGGAVNAATGEAVLVAGSLATVYGDSLAKSGAQAESLPVPDSLEGVSVSVNGVAAPVLFVSPFQVNFQVPWTTREGSAEIAVAVDGVAGNTIQATVARVAPGIFSAVHGAGSSPINAGSPAAAGETIVIYATGLGKISPMVADGHSSEGDTLPRTLEEPGVTLGGSRPECCFPVLRREWSACFK
jgi:uncharacterized protein (TIGR03437 family)